MNLLKENTEVNLHNLGFGSGYTSSISNKRKDRQTRLHQNCASKDTIKKVKKQFIEHEENSVNHKSDMGLLPEYIKNSFQFNNEKTNGPILKMVKGSKQTFLQRRYSNEEHMKDA